MTRILTTRKVVKTLKDGLGLCHGTAPHHWRFSRPGVRLVSMKVRNTPSPL
uniref:Uncharacterized protein n=1 Tax=Sphenodon punctatus TaxID=8508 RepID=A0A8D0HAT4_SPHPU